MSYGEWMNPRTRRVQLFIFGYCFGALLVGIIIAIHTGIGSWVLIGVVPTILLNYPFLICEALHRFTNVVT